MGSEQPDVILKNSGVDLSGSGGDWFSGVNGYDRRYVPYNGGLGEDQLAWLRAELTTAYEARNSSLIVIILSITVVIVVHSSSSICGA